MTFVTLTYIIHIVFSVQWAVCVCLRCIIQYAVFSVQCSVFSVSGFVLGAVHKLCRRPKGGVGNADNALADEGGTGVWQILTLDDKWGGGVWQMLTSLTKML